MQDQKQKSETCKQVINMLTGLPDRPSHDIMLPLGKAALLPARLTDTERCHVTLGEHIAALPHAHLPNFTLSCPASGNCLQYGLA